MKLALREAKKGIGRTSPNPCVGAVIVKEGKIIGKGYHKKAGTPHAEINALANTVESVAGATIYVTLEPCNHFGKTPPCSHALVSAKVGRVVVGMRDPNPLVNGSGIDYLLQNRIAVTSGVMERECIEINRPFIKYITTGLPWIVMKAGVSLDGRLNYTNGKGGQITGPESMRAVHSLRDKMDAIMVGRNTVQFDNPSLTTRLGRKKGKDPVRIIVDSDLSLSTDEKIFHLDSEAKTVIVCKQGVPVSKLRTFEKTGALILQVAAKEGYPDLGEVFSRLGEMGMNSVLVEGGGKLHGAILRERLYDFACIFQGAIFAGSAGTSLLENLSFSPV
jgi:diaminohydroxyphosphoribosylaminopyrimidine deaminase/5-amino-6-(5-phosphoribosylamino)uracil reductase